MSAETPTDGEAPNWNYARDGERLAVGRDGCGPVVDDVDGHLETSEWLEGLDVDVEPTAINLLDGYRPQVRLALVGGEFFELALEVDPDAARALADALEDAADQAEAAVAAEARHAERHGPGDVGADEQ